MRAIGFKKAFDLQNGNQFEEIDIPIPSAKQRDILVKVKAVSINPIDTKMRKKDNEDYKILGYDASGIVEEVGEDVTLFKVGDEVYYSGNNLKQGSNAEYQLVDERVVAVKPEYLSHAETAAMPLTSVTTYESLLDGLHVSINPEDNEGKTLLIINGAGGVGSVATQIAKYLGLTVVTTASRPESMEWSKKMGADYVINHRNSIKEEMKAQQIDNFDYIFNTHSNDLYFETMVDVIKERGRIVTLVDFQEKVDMNLLKKKSLTFTFESMFTRPNYETKDLIKQHDYLRQLSYLLDSEVIKTTLNKTMHGLTKENIFEAHKYIEKGESIGKLVIIYEE